MADSSGIQLSEKFNFSRTEDWPKYIRRFESYHQVSELNKKDDTLQINTLTLFYLGGGGVRNRPQ